MTLLAPIPNEIIWRKSSDLSLENQKDEALTSEPARIFQSWRAEANNLKSIGSKKIKFHYVMSLTCVSKKSGENEMFEFQMSSSEVILNVNQSYSLFHQSLKITSDIYIRSLYSQWNVSITFLSGFLINLGWTIFSVFYFDTKANISTD